jgi:hypothetical protein
MGKGGQLMQRMRAVPTVAAILLLSLGAPVPTASLAGVPGGNCSGDWSIVPNPGGVGSFLLDVAAVSPSDAWAVGYGWNGINDIPMVQHWNGVQWNLVTVPRPHGTNSLLYGVSARSADDVWIAGYYNLVHSKTLIEHWDGAVWTVLPSPNPGAFYSRIFAIAAIGPDDVWAVGSADVDFEQSIAMHWDGTSWSMVRTPDLNHGTNSLHAVQGSGPDDVWAVGRWTNGHDGVTQALTEHWDGATWTAVKALDHQPRANFLNGVSAIDPSHLMAVGGRTDSVATLALQWDGIRWSRVPVEWVLRTINVLNDVSADAAGDAWTVGYYYIPGDSQAQTLIEHWDGSAWHIAPSPNEGPVSSLWGVATVSAGEAWAVGWSETSDALIERYCSPEGNR